MENDPLFDKGLKIRKEMLGADYVDASFKNAGEFALPFMRFVTAYAWGAIWGREGLPRKTRSLINLALLTALGRPRELKTHIRGALNNGCTRDEIREVLMQTAVYSGIPAGVEAFRAAREAFAELDRE